MCDPLVLSYGTGEHDALLSVFCRAFQGGETCADGFPGQETAFGVHAFEDEFEALAFGAEEVGGGDGEVFYEEFIGVDCPTTHFVDRTDRDVVPVQGGIEQ
jgi:hypothetical protein